MLIKLISLSREAREAHGCSVSHRKATALLLNAFVHILNTNNSANFQNTSTLPYQHTVQISLMTDRGPVGYQCVDTPFLTVLKTWTSPFEHPVIIHVCVRLEFPEVSATRLASESPNLTVQCLVLHQTLAFCLGGAGNALWGIPTHHRQWLEATGWFLLPSALLFAGRHILLPVGIFCCQSALFFVEVTFLGSRPLFIHFMEIFCASCDSWHQLFPPPYTCMEGFPSSQACWISFARGILIRERLSSWF